MKKQIDIRGLDAFSTQKLADIAPELSLSERFPDLKNPRSKFAQGFVVPYHVLVDALVLLWLEFHRHSAEIAVWKWLNPTIDRAIAAIAEQGALQTMREDHDCLLVQLGIVAGDERVCMRICGAVRDTGSPAASGLYLQSWKSILVARLLHRRKDELEAFATMKNAKFHKMIEWPGASLVEAFVSRDYERFKKVLRGEYDKHWKIATRQNAVVPNRRDGATFLPGLKTREFFWPWAAASFASLAAREGVELPLDGFWIPRCPIL